MKALKAQVDYAMSDNMAPSLRLVITLLLVSFSDAICPMPWAPVGSGIKDIKPHCSDQQGSCAACGQAGGAAV